MTVSRALYRLVITGVGGTQTFHVDTRNELLVEMKQHRSTLQNTKLYTWDQDKKAYIAANKVY